MIENAIVCVLESGVKYVCMNVVCMKTCEVYARPEACSELQAYACIECQERHGDMIWYTI